MNAPILIPLDGSSLAEQALPCGLALARGLNASLVLFQAIDLPIETQDALSRSGIESAALIDQLTRRANGYLYDVAARLREPGLTVQAVVRCGLAADAIIDYVEHSGPGQIVMTTHGYSGLLRWTHGSVAERVVQSASVPVLLIRAQATPPTAHPAPLPCRRILVPLDGSSVAEQALPPAATIAGALRAELVLFRVPIVSISGSLIGEWYLPPQGMLDTAQNESQVYLDHVAGRLQAQGLRASTHMDIGPVADLILNYAEANGIDLIAMCTHGHSGLGRWTLGSVSDRVLRAGHIPMMLVRAHHRSE